MQARDDEILHPAAQSPVGIAVLDALRAAVLRVAIAVGGADPAMSAMQVTTLFNLSASHVATKRLYDGGLTLPSKLPWERAKALLVVLLPELPWHVSPSCITLVITGSCCREGNA